MVEGVGNKFKVYFRGYSKRAPTVEPREHLDCEELLQRFGFCATNPDLKCLNDRIAELKSDKENCCKFVQNAASVLVKAPEKDCSKTFLYAHPSRRLLGAETPFKQYVL